MIKLILFLLLVFQASAFAKMENYVVEQEDGSVANVVYNTESKDSLEDVLKSAKLDGKPILKVSVSDLPKEAKYRKAWKLENGRVVIDNGKKSQIDDALTSNKNKLKALKTKLGLTNDDIETLKQLVKESS